MIKSSLNFFFILIFLACVSSARAEQPRHLTEGGRNDISPDGAWIYFDRVVDTESYEIEIFRIRPDGSDEECLTCALTELPQVIGQPTTHPSGKGILFQGLTRPAPLKRRSPYYHPSWGFNNDFYWLDLESGKAHKVMDCGRHFGEGFGNACLHPHFSPDGTKLVFASRSRSNTGIQDPWEWWAPAVADFSATGVSNVKEAVARARDQFYETHQIDDDGTIYYSFAPGAYPQGVYALRNGHEEVIYAPANGDWVEQVALLEGGRRLVNTSGGRWKPRKGVGKLRMELHELDESGRAKALTHFGKVTSDYSCHGRDFCVVQVADLGSKEAQPQLYIIELSN